MNRQQSLVKMLDELGFLYHDLNKLIVDYDPKKQWETSFTNWLEKGYVKAIITCEQYIYITWSNQPWNNQHQILAYSHRHEKIKQSSLSCLDYPISMDLHEENKLLYIVNRKNVTILDLNFDLVSSWNLPVFGNDLYTFRGIKLDSKNNLLYLTIRGVNEIFICNSFNGQVLKKWGNIEGSSKPGEFYRPLGITINNAYLYICDYSNHRVQVLNKNEGKFYFQWGNGKKSSEKGQFAYPRVIYYDLSEEIFYIADDQSIQLFTRDHLCFQRLLLDSTKDRVKVNSLCVIDDRLYVCDLSKNRLQIFVRN